MKLKDWDINLKIRLFAEGIMNVMFWMFFPFMAIYFSGTFGKEMAGILLVLSQVISVFVGLIGGYSADRFGRRRMMIFSGIGEVICFIFFAWANSPWMNSPMLTFVSFSVLGLFGALYWPASHAMVADVVPEKHRSDVFAVFYTSINISVVVGPILGGIFFFNNRFGLLVACIIASLIQVVLLYKYIHETAPKRKKQEVILEGKGKWLQYLRNELKDYKVITSDKIFLIFIVAGILVAQTFMQLDLLFAVYTNDSVPMQNIVSFGHWLVQIDGKKAFSWLVSENGLLVALFTVVMTRWMTKYKEKTIFTFSSIMYGIGVILFGHTTNIWVLIMAIAIFTSAELMGVGIQETFVSKLAPEHMRGQYFAASSLRFTIGRSIAPMAIPLTVWIGFPWTFNILGLLAFVSGGLYFMMFNMLDQKKAQLNTLPTSMNSKQV